MSFDGLRMSGKGVSRRTLLGAALGVTTSSSRKRGSRFLSFLHGGGGSGSTSKEKRDSRFRGNDEWAAALTAFHEALAQVAAIEAATAGACVEVEEAWLPAHDAAC